MELIILKNKYFPDAYNSPGTVISVFITLDPRALFEFSAIIHTTQMRKMSLAHSAAATRIQSQALNSERVGSNSQAKFPKSPAESLFCSPG